MSHANAPLTGEGRRRLCLRVDAGRPRAHVAAEAKVPRQCLSKWHARWRAELNRPGSNGGPVCGTCTAGQLAAGGIEPPQERSA